MSFLHRICVTVRPSVRERTAPAVNCRSYVPTLRFSSRSGSTTTIPPACFFFVTRGPTRFNHVHHGLVLLFRVPSPPTHPLYFTITRTIGYFGTPSVAPSSSTNRQVSFSYIVLHHGPRELKVISRSSYDNIFTP